MAEKQFKQGEVIFRQGEPGDSFYQVTEGTVGIIAGYGGDDEHLLTEVTKDQFFGEMAVIENYPRSASAVALKDVKVEEITLEEATEYFSDHPDNILLVMKHLGGRLRELTEDYNEVGALAKELDQPEQKEGFGEKLKKHISFFKRNSFNKDGMSAEMAREGTDADHSAGFSKKIETYPNGTIICREGETGSCMYDIHSGRVGIYTGYGTDKEEKLTELYPNTFFGEMGLVSGDPRSATAVALEDNTVVEIISPEDLTELFEKNPPKVNMILKHLSHRLRRLTDDYMDVCKKVTEAVEQ